MNIQIYIHILQEHNCQVNSRNKSVLLNPPKNDKNGKILDLTKEPTGNPTKSPVIYIYIYIYTYIYVHIHVSAFWISALWN
jgi:hypothetical protein